MFAQIAPDEIDDQLGRSVVPHELTHLVFDTAVNNPYHFPPRWLNEGLAVYLSEGYGQRPGRSRPRPRPATSSRSTGWPASSRRRATRFCLAYAESVSAVDCLVRDATARTRWSS